MLDVTSSQHLGQDCAGFESGGAHEDITSAPWDVVVLVPSIRERRGDFEACWDRLRASATLVGARFVVMASADVRNTISGFELLQTEVGSWARDRGVPFVPAGDAWRRYLAANPGTQLRDLYFADSGHPGIEGTTIYAYALYRALARRPAVGLPADIPALRCAPTALTNGTCIGTAALDACVDDDGTYLCDAALLDPYYQNGVHVLPPGLDDANPTEPCGPSFTNRVCSDATLAGSDAASTNVCLASFQGFVSVPFDAVSCDDRPCDFGFACVRNTDADTGGSFCVEQCTPGSGSAISFVTAAKADAFQRAVEAAFAALP